MAYKYPKREERAYKSLQLHYVSLKVLFLFLYKQDCHYHRMISIHKEAVMVKKSIILLF